MADKVLTGVHVVLAVQGKVVGFANALSDDQDFGVQDVPALGMLEPADIEHTSYRCTVRVGSFVIKNKLLEQAGLIPTVENALQAGAIDIQVLNKQTGDLLWYYQYAKCASTGTTVNANSISGQNVTWRCLRKMVPDAVVPKAATRGGVVA